MASLRVSAPGIICLLLLAAPPVPGQSPAAALLQARHLYYTPVDAGLAGFRCEVQFDWKSFMEQANHQAIPAEDSRLKYLQSIQMTVEDDLRGAGQLHWNASAPAPGDSEDSIGKIRSGMQQMWAGFFQTWNGFMTGDLLTPDAKAEVTTADENYKVSVRSGGGVAEQTYDRTLLLHSIRVSTPTLESLIEPVFTRSPQGLLLTSLNSTYKQPPDGSPTIVKMSVAYASVGTFQLPSTLGVSVGPAQFTYHLTNCTVQMKTSSKQ